MVLLLSAVFFILGLVILSFRGFFGTFPDNWQWVGIIMAGVGLLMGTPSVLQMLLGRPRLIAYYKKEPEGLGIMLKNLPIKSGGVWHRFGIRRDTIQSLEIRFCLSESGSGEVKQPIIQAIIYDHADGKKKNRVTLPPTFSVGAGIEVVFWDSEKSEAFLVGDSQRSPLKLSPGRYRIVIAFQVDGNPINKSMDFVVGGKSQNLIWVLPSLDREDYRIL